VIHKLVDQPGAFVREVALHARMLAAHEHRTQVTPEMLDQSIQSLLRQVRSDADYLHQRRPMGLANANANKKQRSPFGFKD
jgi:hypothetical protein